MDGKFNGMQISISQYKLHQPHMILMVNKLSNNNCLFLGNTYFRVMVRVLFRRLANPHDGVIHIKYIGECLET